MKKATAVPRAASPGLCFGEEVQKPGEHPNRPGEYVEVGPRGGSIPNPRQVTIEPRDPKLPPTQAPGRKWERQG